MDSDWLHDTRSIKLLEIGKQFSRFAKRKVSELESSQFLLKLLVKCKLVSVRLKLLLPSSSSLTRDRHARLRALPGPEEVLRLSGPAGDGDQSSTRDPDAGLGTQQGKEPPSASDGEYPDLE